MGKAIEQTLLDAVDADATSAPFNVESYRHVGIQLLSAAISSGNGVFTVEGTVDGTNWVALNMLVDNVTNTNVQNLTRVASKTLSTNSSVIVWIEPSVILKAIRVKVDVTTDGEYSAFAVASE